MEKRYEQSFIQKLGGVVMGLLGGLVFALICIIVLVIAYEIWPSMPDVVGYGIIGVFVAIYIYAMFQYIKDVFDDFYVTVNNNDLHIYESKKKQYDFDLATTSISYRIKTGSGAFDANFTFTDSQGTETKIDLAKLGKRKVYDFIDDISAVSTSDEVIKL